MRWIGSREPRTLLVAGWIVFVLSSYPGYLDLEATLQLFRVRTGEWSDQATLMAMLWSTLEYVAAGPFPMLVVQSGLFLFGLAAILRTLLAPGRERACAVTAAGVLLFPPVFAVMAVISPDALLAGLLVAGTAAILDGRRGWRVFGGALFVIACSCRPEITPALVPLALLVVTKWSGWRRVVVASAITIGVAGVARVAELALTSNQTYAWRQRVMMTDVVGTLRRAKVTDESALRSALVGLPLAPTGSLSARMAANNDALRWWPLITGDNQIFEPITTDDQAAALTESWFRVISGHPGAYVAHRWAMTRAILGIGSGVVLYDDFGDPALMAPLHHRATASDWQYGMQRFVRLVAKTPVFRPWLYLALAIPALLLSRRKRVLQALLASGLIYELMLLVFAAAPEHRYSHWLVATVCIALAAAGTERIVRPRAA